MIASVNKAILHIIDTQNRLPMLSERELDTEDAFINTYITRQVERVYDDASHRNGEFKPNSGFKYHISEYKAGNTGFTEFSRALAERYFNAAGNASEPEICDLIICDLTVNEKNIIGILKLPNKVGFTHRVIKDENGIFNNLINHYAILPNMSQKVSEYAFVDTDSMGIRYRGGNYKIDGERVDLFSELLLECEYEISSREAVNTVTKTAKRVTEENGGDTIAMTARLKECVIENIEDRKSLDTAEIAEHVFDGRPAMKEEFKAKIENANVPPEIEVNTYVKKKVTSDIKLVTDTGIAISFPAEYYMDSKYVDIINNADGTISIQINNIGELINK